METEFKRMDQEKFDDYFTLIDNHIDTNAAFDGKMFETYGDELAFVMEMAKENRVITITECDGDMDEVDSEGEILPHMYYSSGMHIVNRIGYLITEEPIEYMFDFLID